MIYNKLQKLSIRTLAIILLSAPVCAESQGKNYRRTCGYCHDTGIGPVLTGRNMPEEYVVSTVRTGIGAMPSFRETEISIATLKEIISYLDSVNTTVKTEK